MKYNVVRGKARFNRTIVVTFDCGIMYFIKNFIYLLEFYIKEYLIIPMIYFTFKVTGIFL
jgi:hypothetical protein